MGHEGKAVWPHFCPQEDGAGVTARGGGEEREEEEEGKGKGKGKGKEVMGYVLRKRLARIQAL